MKLNKTSTATRLEETRIELEKNNKIEKSNKDKANKPKDTPSHRHRKQNINRQYGKHEL